MKILTEIGWGHKKGGARRVTFNLLPQMAKISPDHEYLVVSNSCHKELYDKAFRQFQLSAPIIVPQVIWDQFLFPHIAVPRLAKKLKPDVIHHTTNMASFLSRRPCVVTIHDMIPFILPESFRMDHLIYQKLYFKHAVQKADKIITVSENSKKDICRILKVPDKKVVVAPLASGFYGEVSDVDKQKVIDKFQIKKPFFLFVGSIHPRKNLGRIIEAFSNLKKKKNIQHLLVVAGSVRWKTCAIFKSNAYRDSADHIMFVGPPSDKELAALYSLADALLWPSLYEGFGLPVLEAMSFGIPVVTSNCSSLPEVAGDAALLVDPYSVDEISSAISKLADDSEYSRSLGEKGRLRSKQFSWEKSARIVLDVLESVGG